MTMRISRDTVTFMRPFLLAGQADELPAGKYEVVYEQEISDVTLSSNCLRTSVLLHLPPKIGGPSLSRELRVSWESLESALVTDQAPRKDSGRLLLNELLCDPLVCMVMRSDNVAEGDVRRVATAARANWSRSIA